MDSYQVEEWGRPLRFRSVSTPVPSGTEVLVKISACGVCHSDVHIREGRYDMGEHEPVVLESIGINIPLTMGHEIVGVVEAVGPDANIEIGTSGIVFPWIGCGKCRHCAAGSEIDCPTPQSLGTRRAGGYSTHVLVPHPRYIVDYSGIDRNIAATAACSGLTAYSAVRKIERGAPDDVVMIIGAGGLGLAALEILQVTSSMRVVVVDRSPEKLALAKSLADLTILSGDANSLSKLKEYSNGGVRAVLDFVGVPSTFEFGISALGKGGTLVEVGLFGGSTILPIPMLPMRNLKIMGSYVGTLDELKELLDLIRDHKLGQVPLFVRSMSEINDILDELSEGGIAGRVLVQP